MSKLNHFAISSLLGSEIAGEVNFAHGQIASLGDAQKYVDVVRGSRACLSRELSNKARADVGTVTRAFIAVREQDGDQKSPDFYVADPARNARFIEKCRELALSESEYILNKTLFYARKKNLLPRLHSVKTRFDHEDYAFASEFAATELRYETGASIDDLLCHPTLSARFDAIARKLAPGYEALRYRWAILSIRKAGRRSEWKPEYRMPELTESFKLLVDPLEQLPASSGVYLLLEKGKPLYARSTAALRHGIELHRQPEAVAAIANPFWQPDLSEFTVSYATISDKKLLRPTEKKLIEDWKPIFNIPRAA